MDIFLDNDIALRHSVKESASYVCSLFNELGCLTNVLVNLPNVHVFKITLILTRMMTMTKIKVTVTVMMMMMMMIMNSTILLKRMIKKSPRSESQCGKMKLMMKRGTEGVS